MPSARAVFLDLDGTLLDYDDRAWQSTVREVCATLAATVAGLDAERLAAAYATICAQHWRAAEGGLVAAPSGSLSGYAIWRELWQRALVECGCPDDHVAALALEHYRNERHRRYRLFADATAVLAQLRDAVDALVVVTNGPSDTQRDKLTVTGLAPLFDAVLISGELGVAKPDRRIFDRALHDLGLAPTAAWHVGDSFASDVTGARNAGLGAGIWLNRTGSSQSDPAPWWEIRSLHELPALLAQEKPTVRTT